MTSNIVVFLDGRCYIYIKMFISMSTLSHKGWPILNKNIIYLKRVSPYEEIDTILFWIKSNLFYFLTKYYFLGYVCIILVIGEFLYIYSSYELDNLVRSNIDVVRVVLRKEKKKKKRVTLTIKFIYWGIITMMYLL